MAHVHTEDRSTYYLEQLCTIALCGALGGVALMLSPRGMMQLILAPKFQWPVILSGITLLVLVAVRAVAVWRSVGSASDEHVHDQDHDHEHDMAAEADTHTHAHDGDCCEHAHGHEHEHEHEHEHADQAEGCCDGHDHEHGWNPIRYSILLLPIVLFFLDLPNKSFSNVKVLDAATIEDSEAISAKGGDVMELGFKELEQKASNQEARAFYEGRTGKIKGQLARGNNDHVFTLVRFKMTCCAADAIPLRVLIIAPQGAGNLPELQWVEVEGQIQFRKRRDQDEYIPVIQVPSQDKIRKIPPEPQLYLQ